MPSSLSGKRIVLGVTGGISAYKSAELCRLLRKAGAEVHVVMTRAAREFITPLTLQTLSGHPVSEELFDRGAEAPGHEASASEAGIGHIRLADEADMVVVAPATADVIARFAAGLTDDLLAAVVLATRAPVLLAPAMNVNMWENPLTRRNLGVLVESGRFATVGPDAGELACGWIGAGRLVDPADILAAIEARLGADPEARDLSGRKVVVTAGPTVEGIDDVRFISNRSSGKMGFALAAEAARRGADVTLIAGPVALATPPGVGRRIDVESALDMRAALEPAAVAADVVVMAAAVSDFRPAERRPGKLSRREQAAPTLALTANPDLLAELGRARRGLRPLLVGFAAEIGAAGGALIESARRKLEQKSCDVVVANDIGAPGLGMGSDRAAVVLVFADGSSVAAGPAPKATIAREIWSRLAPLVAPVAATPARRGHLRAT